jgi:hypothetical protein
VFEFNTFHTSPGAYEDVLDLISRRDDWVRWLKLQGKLEFAKSNIANNCPISEETSARSQLAEAAGILGSKASPPLCAEFKAGCFRFRSPMNIRDLDNLKNERFSNINDSLPIDQQSVPSR